MRFLLDMGVSPEVGAWLRGQGHDAKHMHDEGLDRLADAEIVGKAAIEQRTILTCDLDFAELVALSGDTNVSIVLFRTASMRPHRVVERLARVLPDCAAALEAGAVIVVEDARHRVRRLPVGG